MLFAEPKRMCSSCNEELTLDKFYSDGTNKDGEKKYRRDCKDCYRTTRLKTRMLKRIVVPAPKKRGRK